MIVYKHPQKADRCPQHIDNEYKKTDIALSAPVRSRCRDCLRNGTGELRYAGDFLRILALFQKMIQILGSAYLCDIGRIKIRLQNSTIHNPLTSGHIIVYGMDTFGKEWYKYAYEQNQPHGNVELRRDVKFTQMFYEQQ